MKNHLRTFSFLIAFPVTSSLAADYTWDGATDMNWDTSTANWSGSAWANGSGNNAIFGATGVGTVALTEAITAGTLTFNTAGYTLDTNGNSLTATTLAGAGAFTKTGNGVLSLSANSGFTGGLTVNGGSVSLADNVNFTSATGGIQLGSDGTLELLHSSSYRTLQKTITGTGTLHAGYIGTTAIVQTDARGKLSDFHGTLQIGRISGSGGGFVRVLVNGLGAGASVEVSDGGQFWNQATGGNYTNAFTIQGISGTSEGLGAIRVYGNQEYSGTITVNGSARISGDANWLVSTFSGKITGGDLELGGGTGPHVSTYKLTNNSNDYNSTTFTRGTLLAGGDTVFGSGTFTQNGGALSSDSTTDRSFANPYVIAGNSTLGNGTYNGKLTFTGATSIPNNDTTITTPSDVEIAGEILGSGSIYHVGTGTLTLSGGGSLSGPNGIRQSGGAGAINIDGTWTNTPLRTKNAAGDAIINIFGDITSNGQDIIGQNAANHTGIIHIKNGGTYTHSGTQQLILGNNVSSATGVIHVESGGMLKFTSTSTFSLGRDGATGILNINGGIVETAKPIQDSDNQNNANSKSYVNFDGGTLRATANIGDILLKSKSLSTYRVQIQAGGGTVDTGIYSVGISQDLLEDSGSTGGGFTKEGSGTLTLTGSNNYTGTTHVSAGTLLVNGTHTGSGLVTVSAGATLGGTGKLAADTTLEGTLSPGSGGIESIEIGALSFDTGSIFNYELTSDASPTGDLAASLGALTIASGATLALNDLAPGTAWLGEKLTLISYNGPWNGGVFTYNGSPLNNGAMIHLSGNDWLVRYDDTSGGNNFIADQAGSASFFTMTVVPEPGTIGLLVSGMLFLRTLVRKKKSM